jgi:hypothetical protein
MQATRQKAATLRPGMIEQARKAISLQARLETLPYLLSIAAMTTDWSFVCEVLLI